MSIQQSGNFFSSKQMNPIVDFVAADAQGIITKETWRATAYACPRCKNAQGNVWALISEKPLVVMGAETRIFLCVACHLTAIGLNGFKAAFDTSRRAQQIIDLGFNAAAEQE